MGSLSGIFSPFFKFNDSSSDAKADRTAIESDFGTIGQDIARAVMSYNK
jgi:hypothetical protein